jgi:hypothetical protein
MTILSSGGGIIILYIIGFGIAFFILRWILQEFFGTNDINNELIDIKKEIVKLNERFDAQSNLMLCPQCIGKGFIDNEDIKRLYVVGKNNNQQIRTCNYCDATGYVPKGHTKLKNPSI